MSAGRSPRLRAPRWALAALLPLLLGAYVACGSRGPKDSDSAPSPDSWYSWGCCGDTYDRLSTDHDGDGYSVLDGDCDGYDGHAHPGALETCDAVDEDCDGVIDDGFPGPFYRDADLDGHGDPSGVAYCEAPDGYVTDATDCDDTDPRVHPGAAESCDTVLDANCDGFLGNEDRDGDGSLGCADCDDADPTVHPGAGETCTTPVDLDCDGAAGNQDGDGDGFLGCRDCDDGDAGVVGACSG